MTSRELIAIAVLLGAGHGAAIADEVAPAVPELAQLDHHLAGRLIRLADHHYRTQAYYRAISAYQELALFADDDATRRYAAIRIAMSYHHGRQLDDALAGYRAALTLTVDPELAQALRIQLAVARVERSFDAPGSEAFDAIAAELAPSAAGGSYRTLALAQLARIDGVAGRTAEARAATDRLRAACVAPAPGCDLEPALRRALDRPPAARRSPWLGVALSLAVPGSGSVYGGHLVDGLYYFALTTLAGLGALDVHDGHRAWTDQKVTFYGLTTLAAIFYAGGALQGYVSVARGNAVRELAARRALWRDTDRALPLEDAAPR